VRKTKKVLFQNFQKKLEAAKNLLGLINITREKNQEGFISDFPKN